MAIISKKTRVHPKNLPLSAYEERSLRESALLDAVTKLISEGKLHFEISIALSANGVEYVATVSDCEN